MGKHKSRIHRPRQDRPAAPRGVVSGLGLDLQELQRARTLWQLNRFDESLALFARTARQHPNNLLALIDASRALGARFEITEAEGLLDRLITLGARNAQILHLAGQSYRMIFRPDKAFECFRRALDLDRNLPDTQLELAVLLERRHRLDEALDCIEECLRVSADYAEARLFKARLLRRAKNETGAESLLRQLADDSRNHPLVRAQAWSELAQMLDRHAEYDAAMAAMLECKKLLLPLEGPVRRESDAIVRILRTIAETVTAGHFQRWAEAGQAFAPRKLALMTSFPRSGTTLLEQLLDSHPGLVSSDEREAFARDVFPAMWRTATVNQPTIDVLDAIASGQLAVQRDRYLAYMAAALGEAIGDRVHLDKNPPFTLLIPAFLRLFPEAKLLIALRDPRDVVLSCFMQYLPLNTNSICYLTIDRAAERYATDLGVWRRLRDLLPSPGLEIRYEDVVADLEGQARRALAFLDLPWDPRVLGYRERLKEKAVASPTYEAVSQPLYTHAIGRWRNYEKYFTTALPKLQPLVDAFGYG